MNIARRPWLLVSAGMIACAASGCGGDSQPVEHETGDAEQKPARPLRVLVVDAPQLATRIERYWKSQTDAPFEVRQTTVTEAQKKPRFAADVVIYPAELLGTWAEAERLSPLSDALLQSDAFDEPDLLTHLRTTEVQWGRDILAVALGSPTLVLYYRADLFAERNLQPPATWAEYQQLLAALTKPPASDQVTALEPLEHGWAGLTFLARAACYVRHRDEYAALFNMHTMEPALTRPPFVRALTELVTAASTVGHVDIWLETTPTTARAAIYAGECALAWTWPSSSFSPASPPASTIVDNLRLAALPGSLDVFNLGFNAWEQRAADVAQRVPLVGSATMLASVTREARRAGAAEHFVACLSQGDAALEIATAGASAAPFRKAHLRHPQPWVEKLLPTAATNDFVALARATQASGLVLVPLRIPGAREYHAALDDAVRAAARGEVEPDEALQNAAAQFEAITESHGRQQQRLAYLHSLGLER